MSNPSLDIKRNVLGNQRAIELEIERFASQADFARTLAGLHPDQTSKWNKLIDLAEKSVADVTKEAIDLPQLSAAVRAAEKILAPLGKVAKTYTVHCVGHAHIDMNWMWSWPETVAVVNDSFTTVLKLMDEFPGFKFSQSQVSIYRIVQEHNPEMFQRIVELVKQGRWEVTASHWVENDKNMAGAESLCRHILYSRQYFARHFAMKPEEVPIDFSPDTFGHAITVPTYLNRGAVKYYYLHRPGVHTPTKPEAFWWEAPDGSRVLVKNDMRYGYNGTITPWLGGHVLNFAKETGCRDAIFVYGVGDHGGGPTRRDLALIVEMDAWPVFPQIRFSTMRDFYEALERQSSKLPTLTCELNTEFTGCYTTQTLIKKANRFGENKLADAELFASIANAAAGFDYPLEQFSQGWQDTLFSHFHDILPGSGVHDTRTFTHGQFQKTMATTSMIETRALRLLASKVNTHIESEDGSQPANYFANATGGGAGIGSGNGALSVAEQSDGSHIRPFVVFNPLAQARSEIIEATVWDNGRSGPGASPLRQRHWSVRTADGKTIPAQIIDGGGFWGHDFVTLAFPVQVPALGYTTATVVERASALALKADVSTAQTCLVHHCDYAPIERAREGLENDLVRLELDPITGGIARLTDKSTGLAIIDTPHAPPLLDCLIERAHPMSAWSIFDGQPGPTPRLMSIKRKGTGPYKAALELNYTIAESEMLVTLELRSRDPNLYVRIVGTWFQRGNAATGFPMLRLLLPTTLRDAKGRYEIPFGAIDRAINDGQELPALQWAQVSGKIGNKNAGLLLANDCKHGYSLNGSTLGLTLIRSSIDPDILPEIGKHEVSLAILPFSGDMTVSQAVASGNALNHVLRVVGTDMHDGAMPTAASFLAIEPANVILVGVKKAEDHDALIVRLCEVEGHDTTATIKFNADLLGKPTAAKEIDLMERETDKSSAKISGAVTKVKVPARGISTLSVKLQR